MKDIPFFTTEFGVASLMLGQIPYRSAAYIHVRTVVDRRLDELLAECAGFCRAAGAEQIFWTGDDTSDTPHSTVLEMRGVAQYDPDKLENLFPVTEQTVSQWRQIHNDRMQQVDHAVFLTAADEKKLLAGGAYFIHRSGELLGIGWLEDDCIRAIAAVKPGAGERVAHTLMSLAPGRLLRLEVASTNLRAIRLYESLGFLRTGEKCRWYKK